MTEPVEAGWYRDPGSRYYARWWTGARWTDHAATSSGEQLEDSLNSELQQSRPEPLEPQRPAPNVAAPIAQAPIELVPREALPVPVPHAPKIGPAAGWYRDPTGRFERRYWDGGTWSAHVVTGTQQTVDAIVGDYAPPVVQPPAVQQLIVQAAPEAKRRRGCFSRTLSIAAGIFLGFALLIGGCAALLSGAFNEAAKQLDREQAAHAITPAQFDALTLGTSQSDVITQLGKQPEDTQEFVTKGVLSESEIGSSCIYYNKVGGSFGDRYQFCFTNGALDSKNSY
jgi:hypothetical protein